MKKLVLLLVFITAITNAQIVNIPNANFKARLLLANSSNGFAVDLNGNNTAVDLNGDGNIQVSEAQNIKTLKCNDSYISDLTGIEAFVNLDYLDCTTNTLTQLNISSLTNLRVLNCGYNNITTMIFPSLPNLENLFFPHNNTTFLDVSNLTNLTFLYCRDNFLTTIDLTNLNNLTFLGCANNHLTSLNVSNLVNLTDLSCEQNQLTSIDVSALSSLTSFGCSYNSISQIDVSNLVNVTYLGVRDNLLTTLDVSNLSNLNYFDFRNNQIATIDLSALNNLNVLCFGGNLFTTMDLSSMTHLTEVVCADSSSLVSLFVKNGRDEYLSFNNCPNLTFICADDSQIAAIQNSINQNNMPNVVATSYCSFSLGGNHNTITGNITFDANNNGCNSSDVPQPNIKVKMIDSSSAQGFSFTNNSGGYTFYTLQGNYTIAPFIENPTFFNVSPVSSLVSFANSNNNSVTRNFCITSNGVHNDTEVMLMPLLGARPGFDARYKIVFRNKGNQMVNGTINFNFDDTRLDFVSATINPDVQTPGNLTWNYSNLMPFESRSITITLNVNSPTESPAVNIGDQLSFDAIINPVSGDQLPIDNISALKQIVVGSLDPNDKTCIEGDIVSTSQIGNYLHYNINFENTGTFQAENIVVKDMIDTAKFDITTLQIMDSSHPMTTRITGNKVEFIFENINLAAAEHGNVAFKIKTKSTLVAGNTVTNNANIYFDYNAPVLTNTASTTFQALSSVEFTADASVAIYPNPAKNNVNVTCDSAIKSIQLFDVQGRILETQLVNQTQVDFDVSKYSNGVYFIKVITEKGIKAQKLVKE